MGNGAEKPARIRPGRDLLERGCRGGWMAMDALAHRVGEVRKSVCHGMGIEDRGVWGGKIRKRRRPGSS